MARFKNPADTKFYQAARSLFRQMGLSHAQLQQATDWAMEQRPGLSPQDLAAGFQAFASRNGWSESDMMAATQVHGSISQHGPDRFIEAPSPQYDARVIAAAEQMMKSDPDSYWADHEGCEAYEEALSRCQERADDLEARTVVHKESLPRTSDQDRRIEIERAMREDGGRAYWSDPQMQSEYRDILAMHTTPAGTMEPGSVGHDSNARPSGGSEASQGFTVQGF